MSDPTNNTPTDKENKGKFALLSKVIITNVISLIVAWAAYKKIDIPPEMQTEVTMAILTIANTLSIVFRFYSTKPVHIKKPKPTGTGNDTTSKSPPNTLT